jgi:hypothetical protein
MGRRRPVLTPNLLPDLGVEALEQPLPLSIDNPQWIEMKCGCWGVGRIEDAKPPWWRRCYEHSRRGQDAERKMRRY